jgi:protein disulfide-isomerase-like protein
MFRLFLVSLFATQTLVLGLELTKEAWHEQTDKRTIFVKFFAPWCGHCKKMKPDWDKLMLEYEENKSIFVAEVNCIEAGKDICKEINIKGFPTIKFGANYDLQDYKGGRDFESLSQFASELQPFCDIKTKEHCSNTEKDALEEYESKSSEDLRAIVADYETGVKKENEAFESEVDNLQSEFINLKEKHNRVLENFKEEFNIGIVKALLYFSKEEDSDSKMDL